MHGDAKAHFYSGGQADRDHDRQNLQVEHHRLIIYNAPMTGPVTRNLTILLTDIKEFTALTSKKSRADILKMLERHKQIVLPILQSKDGRLIKTIGDAFLVVFDSPTDGVLAGVAVQEALSEYNRGKAAGDRFDVRIAINVGEVNITDNDIFGDPVNITARIESIAEAGEVFFTEAVYLAMNKTEVPSSEVGMLQLKGLPEKVRVYKVVREHPVEELPAGEKAEPSAAPAVPLPSAASAPAPVAAAFEEKGKPKPRIPWRRIGALLIDVVICSIIVDTLFKTEQQTVQIQTSQEDVRREVAKAMREAGKALPTDMRIKLSGDGIEFSASKTPREPQSRLESRAAAAEAKVKRIRSKRKRIKKRVLKVAEAANRSSENAENIRIQIDGQGIRIGTEDQLDEGVQKTVLYNKGGVRVVHKKEKKNPAFALFWVVYSTFFLSLWAATPGAKILKLKVVKIDGGPIDWRLGLVRSLFTIISASVVLLGFLWAFWEKDRRGWHDLLAGTKVVAN